MKSDSSNISCVRGRASRGGDQTIGLMTGRGVELGAARYAANRLANSAVGI